MDPRTQERVERWDSRPYEGGDDLSALADREFSGAVEAAGGWLFMLNGRVVGVVDGTLDAIRNAPAGTVYDAPDSGLPLLCSMTAQGGDTRAKYYTNETPISEVDEKLQSASFTGYLELSEQVLSGDYYVVYYGGRRMPAAYIGSAERLLTGDEAFERADDEVGIYQVIDVDVEVTDVDGDAEAATASGATQGAQTGDDSDRAPDSDVDRVGSVDETATSSPTATDDGPSDGVDADADDRDQTTAGGTGRDEPASASADVEGSDASASRSDVTASTSAGDGSDGTPASTDATTGAADQGSATTNADVDGITTTGDPGPDRPERGITDATTGSDDRSAESTGSHHAEVASSSGDDDDGPSPARADADGDAASEPSTSVTTESAAGTDPATDTDRSESVDEAARSGRPRSADGTSPSDRSASVDGAATSDPAGSAEGPTAGGVAPSGDSGAAEESPERFEEEARWRETTRIPSIDPDASSPLEDSGPSRSQSESRSGAAATTQSRATISPSDGSTTSTNSDPGAGTGSQAAGDEPAPPTEPSSEEPLRSDMLEREDKIDQLTQRVTELEARRDELRAEYEALEEERDRVQTRNQELVATVDQLEARIEELEAELERARSQPADEGSVADEASSRSTQLSPAEALSGTNVFVRYDSKSQPTLESAHGGGSDRQEVAANLNLERHTQFDEGDALVTGKPYDEFVEETMEYRFVEWLVTTLPFEVRDTGRSDGLGDLYDVIPRIDRAELSASIPLDDDDEAVPDQVEFDVVAFDKMGTPLLVANLNDSREPATRDMLESLEASASAVTANYPDLGGAFAVTSSFFEPGALEITEEATAGGFLNRGSKLSYVSLSRKQGYHLCLVEARSAGFHVTVPEL